MFYSLSEYYDQNKQATSRGDSKYSTRKKPMDSGPFHLKENFGMMESILYQVFKSWPVISCRRYLTLAVNLLNIKNMLKEELAHRMTLPLSTQVYKWYQGI